MKLNEGFRNYLSVFNHSHWMVFLSYEPSVGLFCSLRCFRISKEDSYFTYSLFEVFILRQLKMTSYKLFAAICFSYVTQLNLKDSEITLFPSFKGGWMDGSHSDTRMVDLEVEEAEDVAGDPSFGPDSPTAASHHDGGRGTSSKSQTKT